MPVGKRPAGLFQPAFLFVNRVIGLIYALNTVKYRKRPLQPGKDCARRPLLTAAAGKISQRVDPLAHRSGQHLYFFRGVVGRAKRILDLVVT